MADTGSEIRRDENVDIATVSRTMERLQATDNSPTPSVSLSNTLEDRSLPDRSNQHTAETDGNNSLSESNVQASCAASSASN